MTSEYSVRRAKRGDLAEIAKLVTEASQHQLQVDEADVMDWLFSKGLMVALYDGLVRGVMAWQTENLVSVTDQFFVWPVRELAGSGGALLAAVEAELQTLMCEANVIVVSPGASDADRVFLQEQGYEPKAFEELHRIWREVLGEFVTEDAELLVKRLRDRMVMAPL